MHIFFSCTLTNKKKEEESPPGRGGWGVGGGDCGKTQKLKIVRMEIDSKYFPIINALIKPISLINALSTPKKKKRKEM